MSALRYPQNPITFNKKYIASGKAAIGERQPPVGRPRNVPGVRTAASPALWFQFFLGIQDAVVLLRFLSLVTSYSVDSYYELVQDNNKFI